MTLLLAVRFLQALAAVLAVALARRQREHRPLAALLVYGAVANTVRIALQQLVVMPAVRALGGDPALGFAPLAPLTGWARVAAHVDQALQLGWSAALASCAFVVFGWVQWDREQLTRFYDHSGRGMDAVQCDPSKAPTIISRYTAPVQRWPPVAPVVVWAALVGYFVLIYPESRAVHRSGYLLADLLAIGAGLSAFVGWLRQRNRAEGMPVTKICMLLIIGLDGVALLGPHLVPGFYTGWDRALGAYVVLYGLLVLIQGGTLWCSK